MLYNNVANPNKANSDDVIHGHSLWVITERGDNPASLQFPLDLDFLDLVSYVNFFFSLVFYYLVQQENV